MLRGAACCRLTVFVLHSNARAKSNNQYTYSAGIVIQSAVLSCCKELMDYFFRDIIHSRRLDMLCESPRTKPAKLKADFVQPSRIQDILVNPKKNRIWIKIWVHVHCRQTLDVFTQAVSLMKHFPAGSNKAPRMPREPKKLRRCCKFAPNAACN